MKSLQDTLPSSTSPAEKGRRSNLTIRYLLHLWHSNVSALSSSPWNPGREECLCHSQGPYRRRAEFISVFILSAYIGRRMISWISPSNTSSVMLSFMLRITWHRENRHDFVKQLPRDLTILTPGLLGLRNSLTFLFQVK